MIKKIITTTLLGSYLNIVRLVANLARVKYLAITVGATGVGLVAHGTQIQLLLSTICSLSITVGIISRLRENKSDPRNTLNTAFTVQTIFSILLIFISLLFADKISVLLFGSVGETLKTFLIIASVPFAILSSNFLEAIFFWKDRYDLYIRASSIATLIGLVLTLGLIYYQGVLGAFWGLFLSSVSLLICFLYYTARLYPLKHIFHFSIHREELKFFWKVSFVMFLSSLGTYGAQWILRRGIIETAGVDVNGIVQVPFALSNFYMPFLISSLWGHFLPLVSAKGFNKESLADLLTMLKFIVSISCLSIVAILIWPEFIIRWVFARPFVSAAGYLPLQLLGDWFYLVVLTVSVYLLGTGRLRNYAQLWVCYYLIYIGYGLVSIYNGQVIGYFYAYILAGFVVSLLFMTVLLRTLEFKKYFNVLSIMIVSFLVLGAQCYIHLAEFDFLFRLILPAALLCFGFIGIKYFKLNFKELMPNKVKHVDPVA